MREKMPIATLSYTTLDSNNVKASAPFYVVFDDAVTVAELQDTWVEFGALYDAVSGGVIIGGGVSIGYQPDGAWKDTPVAGSDNSDVLNLNYANLVTLYKFGLIVNMLRTALVSGGRPIIASGAIKTLSDYILASHATPTFTFTDTGAHDLSALVDAFQSDRKHRRQLKANSTVVP
jgi:hypothetical protein